MGHTAAQHARWLRGRAGVALHLFAQRCADPEIGDFLRILLTTVSEGRREGLGTARPFASRYETQDEHDPRMRILCWRVPMYRGGRYAGSCVVCMWFMGLRYVKQVYESSVLASSALSMRMSVLITRFNTYTLQERTAQSAWALAGILGGTLYAVGPP